MVGEEILKLIELVMKEDFFMIEDFVKEEIIYFEKDLFIIDEVCIRVMIVVN